MTPGNGLQLVFSIKLPCGCVISTQNSLPEVEDPVCLAPGFIDVAAIVLKNWISSVAPLHRCTLVAPDNKNGLFRDPVRRG